MTFRKMYLLSSLGGTILRSHLIPLERNNLNLVMFSVYQSD
jgi:hypothetical protein